MNHPLTEVETSSESATLFEPTPDQERALKHLLSEDWGTPVVFLTGEAGTGKSTLLREFVGRSRNVAVVAPSGLAAVNVGGSTIHRMFWFPIGPLAENDPEIKEFERGSHRRAMFENLRTLVVDEVSMVRADLMDAIETSLRLNGPRPGTQFGGVRVLLVGDPLQLDPIVKSGAETRMINEEYGCPLFFRARCFASTEIEPLRLTTFHRQNDPRYLAALNHARRGNAGGLPVFNDRVGAAIGPAIRLCPTNALVDSMNHAQLARLNAPMYRYEASIAGDFPESDMPTSWSLQLKVGARVMHLANWDGLYNGCLATVIHLDPHLAVIETDDGKVHPVRRYMWNRYSYFWDSVKRQVSRRVVGTFEQLPLRLAWALTIHKSQGLTFDRMSLDMGDGAFANGQAYVALSRCRSLGGLSLARGIRPSDLKVNRNALNFYESLPDFGYAG